MTPFLLYLLPGVLCAILLAVWQWNSGTTVNLVLTTAFSLAWPLVVLALLGFAAGVALGWLEGMLP